MDNIVNLTVMTTATDNKKLKPDSNGYYKVTLGAFNVRNTGGAVYSFDGIPAIVADKQNVLNRRMTASRLRSEAEHPVREPGMTDEQFILRNIDIKVSRSCAHIKEISLKETKSSENIPGIGNIVLLEALIKPSGPFSSGLKESLENQDEDTCFSIRCFTKDVASGSNLIKYVMQIITWDWVNEPGIMYASKLGKPSVESRDIGVCDIANLKLSTEETNSICSVESAELISSVCELVDTYNYIDNDIINTWK